VGQGRARVRRDDQLSFPVVTDGRRVASRGGVVSTHF
jgi:hypothetical protein